MKPLRLITLALLAMLAPAVALAAEAQNANTFSDPAMSFTAPDGFKRVPLPEHDPAKFEQKAVVAAFVKNPGTQDAVTIAIAMDNFEGDVAGYTLTSDNELRGSSDGVFIKKTDIRLANGMPASFEECTIGSGFAQITSYRILWADGVRGVSVMETARYGTLDAKTARADLANLSAVAYPRNRY